MRPQNQLTLDWLETHLRLRNEAAGCVFVGIAALLMTLLLFLMQGYALWFSPTATTYYRHGVLAPLQIGTAALIGFYASMALYGWRQYRSPEPYHKASYFLITTLLVTSVLFTLLYGLHDSPFGLMLLAAIALARAWHPVRVLLPGMLFGGALLVAGEILAQSGRMPYAPLLSEPVVTGQAVASWWIGWFMAIYYLGSLIFAVLMLLMFSIMSRHHVQLKHLARVDALTGLLNRAAFMELLEEQCVKQRRTKRPACLLLCDVDHFKQVNDKYGHTAGDRVLVHLGRLLKQTFATHVEATARYGGEEFVILLPEADVAAGKVVAERLREHLRTHIFEFDSHHFSATISIGVVEYRNGDGEAALKVADANLYQAKRDGRDCCIASTTTH